MENQPIYNSIANNYDTIFVDNLSKAEDKKLVKILKPLLKQAIIANKTILDVGCGTGWLLDHTHIPTANYIGFDISTKMVACSSKKHPNYKFYQKQG